MSKSDYQTLNDQQSKKSILELTHEEAKAFFLKPESYCSIDLPSYISFTKILEDVDQLLSNQELNSISIKPENYEKVNHTIINNKDGKYAWRPLQIIHPALYVSLVNKITTQDNWLLICGKIHEFQSNPCMQCLSLPILSLTDKKDKEEQILHWWLSTEQRAIELSLEYEYLIETDITDCYGSIYTHSIPWALHTKMEAKKKENRNNRNLIGIIIDKKIREMQNGQTNGIPQGSVLMDFIAEIVLGYADSLLSKELLTQDDIKDYQIIRYRDDYRLFVNNPQVGEKILKTLTEIITDLGMKINPQKTKLSHSVVEASIKPDKLSWMTRVKSDKSLQKSLLIIHRHAQEYPNSGSVSRALDEFQKRLEHRKKITDQPLVLIAIIVDIAYANPRTYVVCSAIISKLLSFEQSPEECLKIVDKVKSKIYKTPNTGHMQVWLQRITLPYSKEIEYEEPLCKIISGVTDQLWNSDWITSVELKNAIDSKKIFDETVFDSLKAVVSSSEIETFTRKNMEGYSS